MTERSGVEIDYCPKCRGVWLDRGELDKIIEKNGQAVSPPPSSQNNRPDDNRPRNRDDDDDDIRPNDGRRGRRREGFLGDLFDF